MASDTELIRVSCGLRSRRNPARPSPSPAGLAGEHVAGLDFPGLERVVVVHRARRRRSPWRGRCSTCRRGRNRAGRARRAARLRGRSRPSAQRCVVHAVEDRRSTVAASARRPGGARRGASRPARRAGVKKSDMDALGRHAERDQRRLAASIRPPRAAEEGVVDARRRAPGAAAGRGASRASRRPCSDGDLLLLARQHVDAR